MRRETNIGGIALVAMIGLASCGGDTAVRREPPYQLSGRACAREVADAGIAYTRWQVIDRRGCRVDTPLRSPRTARASFRPPLETSCAMLAAWADYERELAEAARQILRTSIVEVRHYGSYACRAMTGNAGRASLHATARAVDISGFVTADGRTISVLRDWDAGDSRERFLHAAAAAACRIFSVVLTPETDRRHADHLHLDIGPWRKCDA